MGNGQHSRHNDSIGGIVARIITIEDSPALQRLLDITMRGTGVSVEPYLGGRAGLAAAIADPPDLVILDLGLPDLSGWDILERLRSNTGTERIPVIITSGDTHRGVADRATKLGAVTLAKPYTAAVLRATVLVLLDTRPVAADSVT